MYKVIVRFKDLQDKNHAYNVGDEFPRNGVKVTRKRIKELMSTENKRGVQLIEEVKEVAKDVDGDLSGDQELV